MKNSINIFLLLACISVISYSQGEIASDSIQLEDTIISPYSKSAGKNVLNNIRKEIEAEERARLKAAADAEKARLKAIEDAKKARKEFEKAELRAEKEREKEREKEKKKLERIAKQLEEKRIQSLNAFEFEEKKLNNYVWASASLSNDTIDNENNNETERDVTILTVGTTVTADLFNNFEEEVDVYFGNVTANQTINNVNNGNFEYDSDGLFLGFNYDIKKGNKFSSIMLNGSLFEYDDNSINGNFEVSSLSFATKFGVNFDYNSFKLEPSITLGAHNIKADSYTTFSGNLNEGESATFLNVKPEVKISTTLSNGIKPYFSIGYNYATDEDMNVMNDGYAIVLPYTGIENFFEAKAGMSTLFFDNLFETNLEIIFTTGDKNSFGGKLEFKYTL